MKLSFWILFITLTLSACGGSSDKDKSPTPSSSSNSASQAHYLIKFSSDAPLSQPNTILPIEPAVKVFNPNHQPIAGVKVNFVITTGDGEIQNTSAFTDSEGLASAGKWNPGSKIGINTLTATVEGLTPIIFDTKTGRSSPDIKLSGYTDSSLYSHKDLSTYINSTYQLATVSASVNGIAIDIKYNKSLSSWQTSFDNLEMIPSGLIVYIVTATDVLGNTADLVVTTILNKPPVLTLSIPGVEENSVLQSPLVEIFGSCIDDMQACTNLHLYSSLNHYRFDGMPTIHEFLDVSTFSGKRVTLTMRTFAASYDIATDRSFYVEPSPFLSLFAKAGNKIIDISNNHVLFVDTPLETNKLTLKVLDVLTGKEHIIVEDQGLQYLEYKDARITTEGVVYALDPFGTPSSEKFIYKWKDDTVSTLSTIKSMKFSQDASWLIYFDGDSFWKRNLGDGTLTLVSDIPDDAIDSVISPQGDIIWQFGTSIYLLRANADVHEIVASDISYSKNVHSLPSTDGINIVYRKSSSYDECSIAVHNGTEEVVLAAKRYNLCPLYVMAEGYIAYQKDSQIWLYHNGNTQQLTVFDNLSNVNIEAIAPDGTVSITYDNKRYVKKPGAELKEIGSGLGTPFFKDNKLFIVIGYTILEAAL